MFATWKRWGLFGVLALVALGAGCNLLSVPFFLFGPEPRFEARMQKLASEDKDEEVKVAILAYSSQIDTRLEFIRIDSDLSRHMANSLKQWCAYNKEKVKIIPPRKVDEYKQLHPDWHSEDLEKIGKDLGADYVIYLEIRSISIAQKTYDLLLKGNAEIGITLVEVNPKDEGFGNKTENFICTYPSEAAGYVENFANGDKLVFRDAFYRYMGERLAWYFTSHPTSREYARN
jgi:hypothetical protein